MDLAGRAKTRQTGSQSISDRMHLKTFAAASFHSILHDKNSMKIMISLKLCKKGLNRGLKILNEEQARITEEEGQSKQRDQTQK
jgi:hypothetical protein